MRQVLLIKKNVNLTKCLAMMHYPKILSQHLNFFTHVHLNIKVNKKLVEHITKLCYTKKIRIREKVMSDRGILGVH